MIPELQRLFDKFKRSSAPASQTTSVDLKQAREAVLASIQDCNDSAVNLLRARIRRAASTKDLRVLRAEVHDAISRQHHQGVAAERIRNIDSML